MDVKLIKRKADEGYSWAERLLTKINDGNIKVDEDIIQFQNPKILNTTLKKLDFDYINKKQSFKITQEALNKLKEHCKKNKTNVSRYVRSLIEKDLKNG